MQQLVCDNLVIEILLTIVFGEMLQRLVKSVMHCDALVIEIFVRNTFMQGRDWLSMF